MTGITYSHTHTQVDMMIGIINYTKPKKHDWSHNV